MSNYDKYVKAFKDAFQLEEDVILEGYKYRDEGWDSVAHMILVSAIEDKFDIMLDADDIVDFSSFENGLEIIKKYDVEI